MTTRKNYLDHKATHREYYAQFVNAAVRGLVRGAFGLDALNKSKDPVFNDIPLIKWDNLVSSLVGVSSKMKEAGDYLTLSGGVYILKEAARQLVEEATNENA